MYDYVKVGYARAIITPDDHVPLAGYGNTKTRISQEFRDDLMLTCIAFSDSDNNTVLLYSSDMISAAMPMCIEARKILNEKLGIPQDHIMLASTHSHSSVAWGETGFESVVRFREKFLQAMVDTGIKAVEDLSEAITYVSSVQTERMNFIRHYKVADGTFTGDNFGNGAAGIIDHTTANDPWIQLIRFVRPGAAKDVLLMNWQAHPCMTSGMNKYVLSADYVGEIRKYVETNSPGVRFAFFQGAAGNHNTRSNKPNEMRTQDVVEYGKIMGDYVLWGLANMRQIPGGKVSVGMRDMELQLDHTTDHLVPQCQKIWEEWTKTYDRPACNKLANEIGLNSIYAVAAVLTRAKQAETENMIIRAFKVGQLGFTCAPYEMFCASGQYIKENSPCAMTFVVSCCNGAYAYLATRRAFAHGCYEVDNRRYPKGTAELLAENFVEILESL